MWGRQVLCKCQYWTSGKKLFFLPMTTTLDAFAGGSAGFAGRTRRFTSGHCGHRLHQCYGHRCKGYRGGGSQQAVPAALLHIGWAKSTRLWSILFFLPRSNYSSQPQVAEKSMKCVIGQTLTDYCLRMASDMPIVRTLTVPAYIG